MKPFSLPNHIVFEELLSRIALGKTVKMMLVGTSMTSFLVDGKTYIYLSPVEDDSEVKCGDIFLFSYMGTYVLHRVVCVCGDDLMMQGDNCFTSEKIRRSDLKARLTAISVHGKKIQYGSFVWKVRTQCSLVRKRVRQGLHFFLQRRMRNRLTPIYFILLLLLMWAPVGRLGIPLNNFILGLRADHLLHASVYLPCSFFLMDVFRRKKWKIWLVSILIGLLTECVQYWLPYRGFDVNDLVANFLGASLGFLILRRFM